MIDQMGIVEHLQIVIRMKKMCIVNIREGKMIWDKTNDAFYTIRYHEGIQGKLAIFISTFHSLKAHWD